MTEALRGGSLSYSKVRAISRIATPENEEALVTSGCAHGRAHGVDRARLPRGVSREEETGRGGAALEPCHRFEWDDDDGSLTGKSGSRPKTGQCSWPASTPPPSRSVVEPRVEVRGLVRGRVGARGGVVPCDRAGCPHEW